MFEIKGKITTAICYAKVVEYEAIGQIRRMCEACGCHVRTLKRVRIMNIRLGNLKEGSFREITGEEYRTLLAQLEQSNSLSERDLRLKNK